MTVPDPTFTAPPPACRRCGDTGLLRKQCPGNGVEGKAPCGRIFRHAPHSYGVPCACPRGARFTSVVPA